VFEVIFVSSDWTPEKMFSYMKKSHGDWLAVELDSDLSDTLKKKYGVRVIPTLVVVKPDGTLVTKKGRGGVTNKQPKEAVEAWMNKEQKP
jgi:nucleoredoxin